MAVKLEYHTQASCRPEHVWQVFQRVEDWPRWNPVMGAAHWAEGSPWQAGSKLSLEMRQPRPVTLFPTLMQIEPPNRVYWVANGMGVKGEQWFAFHPQEDGTTRMSAWQKLSGAPTLLITEKMKQAGLQVFADWFGALKREAERIAAEEREQSA